MLKPREIYTKESNLNLPIYLKSINIYIRKFL
jgi:hypothetical protein